MIIYKTKVLDILKMMILQVLQENLAKALSTSSRFTSTKAQLPVLANIALSAKKNRLLISATNLELSISVSIGAKVTKEGELTIPARVITDLVVNLNSGSLNLSSEKEHLKISSNNFTSTISGMNSSDFPSIPYEVGKGATSFPKDTIIDSLSSVLFAASSDETRPVLTGVLLIFEPGKLTFVATDGFRLSKKQINIKSQSIPTGIKNLILPKNSLSELSRLSGEAEEIKLSLKEGESQVVFGVGDSVLSSRIIDGEFPDFEKIIPKETVSKITLDKEELLRAVKLASVFARDAANVVKIAVGKDTVNVSAESSQSGSQDMQVDAKVEGETKNIKIAFNFRFLEDFLNAVKADDVQIELGGPNSPGVFTDPKDANFLHLIMPVRIQD